MDLGLALDVLIGLLSGAVAGTWSARIQIRRSTRGGADHAHVQARDVGPIAMGAGAGATSTVGPRVDGAYVVNLGSGDAAGRDIHK